VQACGVRYISWRLKAVPAREWWRRVIDGASFTPGTALGGGIMIGIATSSLVLLNGRIAGISGIVGGMLRPARADIAWRVSFLAGMIGAPLIYKACTSFPAVTIAAGYPLLIVAGLLVGVGTRYAGGCTSGHGVCGISRLSVRSLLATLAFMAAGFVTVYLMRHVAGA
jgi:uncharacterized protein